MTLPGQIGTVVHAAAGGNHSLVVTSSGQLYGFGYNRYGQLGNGTNNNSDTPNPTPTLVGLPGQVGPVTLVSAGGVHSLAATASGQLYAFGYNFFGQLGNATNNGTSTPNPTPTLVTLPGQIGTIADISASEEFSLALTSTGQLYVFGSNRYGQLGNATNAATGNPNPQPTPVTLPGQAGPITHVAAGSFHSLAVTSSGQLYAFGLNSFGQLGNATNNDTQNANPTPGLVLLPGQIGPVTQVAGGHDHSLAVTSSGQLYAFGSNQYGALGSTTNNGTSTPNPMPTLVALSPGTTIGTVAKGTGCVPLSGAGVEPCDRIDCSTLRAGRHALPGRPAGRGRHEPADLGRKRPASRPDVRPRQRGDQRNAQRGGDVLAHGHAHGRPRQQRLRRVHPERRPRGDNATENPRRRRSSRHSSSRPPNGYSAPGSRASSTRSRRWPGARACRSAPAFSFSSDQAARVTLTFRHTTQGRRVSGKCVAKTSSNAGKPRCTRTLTDGALRVQAKAGINRLRFEGRISASKKLKPGSYTVLITAANTAGTTSPPRTLRFTIAKVPVA